MSLAKFDGYAEGDDVCVRCGCARETHSKPCYYDSGFCNPPGGTFTGEYYMPKVPHPDDPAMKQYERDAELEAAMRIYNKSAAELS